MNCEEHGDAGVVLGDACGECLNQAFAKEFELGCSAGRKQGLAEAVALLKTRVCELFMARKEDQAAVVRALADSIAGTAGK